MFIIVYILAISNGVSFTIVHDFPNMSGINSFDSAYQNWMSRTDDYTAESFIAYVKSKEPHRVFVTLEQFEKITKGKSEPATKEDFLQENN